MKPLRWRKTAQDDYRNALVWYAKLSSELANRFAAETRQTLRTIETNPAIGAPILVPGIDKPLFRRLPMSGFPYFVIDREFETRISIRAFAHKRRKPDYWM